MVKMIEVESSNIKAVGYDGKDLYVEYNSGTYQYHEVPQKLYEELLKAPSKGVYMSTNIKGYFQYSRL